MLESSRTGAAYATKMDQALTKAVAEWWNGMTKEELLTYLLEQPTVTADMLRTMLANEQCTLGVGVTFSMSSLDAVADFHTDNT